MALLKTALALAPFFLKGPTSRPGRKVAGLVLSLGLIGLSIVFLLLAGFIAIGTNFGWDVAFLALGLTTLTMALALYFSSRGHKVKAEELEKDMRADPIARFIPDSLQDDPRLEALMAKIQEHPMGAAAAAAGVGFVLSSTLFGEEV